MNSRRFAPVKITRLGSLADLRFIPMKICIMEPLTPFLRTGCYLHTDIRPVICLPGRNQPRAKNSRETILTSAIETEPASQTQSLAAPWHTVAVVVAVGLNAFAGWRRAQDARQGLPLNRPTMYLRTILVEWLFLAFVLLGVWLHKSSFREVLGERWATFRAFARDAGIALVFLLVSVIFTSILGPHNHQVGTDPAVKFLMPHGTTENCLWILVALSAGICEEAVYRGYLQHQLIVLSRNAPLGVILSAALFASSHAYQGLRNALVIGIGALMAGTLAFWRKSVRPGMIAHSLQDLLALVVPH
jgi:membrane protease YdiL (CAAX protease family)